MGGSEPACSMEAAARGADPGGAGVRFPYPTADSGGGGGGGGGAPPGGVGGGGVSPIPISLPHISEIAAGQAYAFPEALA